MVVVYIPDDRDKSSPGSEAVPTGHKTSNLVVVIFP